MKILYKDEKIILEIKAVKELVNEHHAQVHNYLKATQMKIGPAGKLRALPKSGISTYCKIIS
jgi:hypothetical protein